MKLFTGCVVSAGLVLCAGAANAQAPAPHQIGSSPYSAASDISGPYAESPETPPPRYVGPRLLPPQAVYMFLRDSGFSPLGIPRQRGLVYTISVIDRGGEDGRVVIDARSGRIIAFTPAYRMRNNFDEDLMTPYGPVGSPPVGSLRGPPRPPASVPHLAGRTPPMPKEPPAVLGERKPQVEKPPATQSAAVQQRPTEPQASPPPAVEAKPAAPMIQPTQEMPKVQGLE